MTLHVNVALWVAKQALWEARLGDFDSLPAAEDALTDVVWADLFPGEAEIEGWRDLRMELRWYDKDWQPAQAPESAANEND